jgi:ribosomal-protein-alanine N-acetyltransferase
MPAILLTTARLALRPLEQADSAAVFGMMSDFETMRFWDWPAFSDRAVVEEIVAHQLADVRSGNALYWAVCLQGSDLALGVCDISEVDMHHARAEIGFLFSRAHWGKGYAAEAVETIVGHAFGRLSLERLSARVHAGNENSKKLLIKRGFTYEGTLKGHILRSGERRDCDVYGRLK